MEARRSSYFWEKVRGLFLNYFLKDWETLCVRASGGNSLRYILNHRRDQVCRSRFFRGNRIVKAMSAPGRRGRGGSRRLALRQRCCFDAPSANVGPLAGIADALTGRQALRSRMPGNGRRRPDGENDRPMSQTAPRSKGKPARTFPGFVEDRSKYVFECRTTHKQPSP